MPYFNKSTRTAVIFQYAGWLITVQYIDKDICLSAFFPGQPGQAGTRKVKPIWILIKHKMMGWQQHQLDHMQIICTLHQSTMPAPQNSFYRPDALPDGQPTMSKN